MADSPGAGLAQDEAQPAPAEESIFDHTAGWLAATKDRVSALTHLALAEAKLAAYSVALMAFLGVLAAVSVLGAWGLVLAALVYGLVQLGVPVWAALLAMGALQALIAWWLWRSALRLSRHLEFSATRAQVFSKAESSP